MSTNIEKWRIFELTFELKCQGNPFIDINISAIFTNEQTYTEVNGFYDGNDCYIIRFMPTEIGKWNYIIRSNNIEINGIKGDFTCIKPSTINHGPVVVKSPPSSSNYIEELIELDDSYHFSYSDGTIYYPFGTTCYAWVHQPLELQEKTLETLEKSPFNKIRMCIFPKHYAFNLNEPLFHVYEKDLNDNFDLTRFNTHFFKLLEKRISQLDELGIEADIILFHPYDKWGFSKMNNQQNYLYLKYIVSRLSAFKNIWWALANEFDIISNKSVDDWELFARIIQKYDPYNHLRSIHNCTKMYDHTKSWITHCSIQRIDVYKTAENTNEWRNTYKKPVVIDECGYEGNIDYGWGNITGEEITRRFWEATVRGGYLGHGETYMNPENILWWSHGGYLHGTSVERIKFLRQIVESSSGLISPATNFENWDIACGNIGDDLLLYYFGHSQPSFRTFKLPNKNIYKVDVIDTWNMTIHELDGVFSGEFKIDLPSKQYILVRMKKVC